jgi:glucosamine--fructose-6-phosphate aminotransferase (isomerizing)
LDGRLYQDLVAAGERLPAQAEAILCRDTFIRNCARKYQKGFKFLFIGRRDHHATALEAAFKMKEFCPGSAPAACAAVLDRKTMALIDHRTVVVVIAPRGDLSARLYSALRPLRTRGAIILTVATEGDRKLANESNHVFEIPDAGEFWSPLLEVLPLQLLARHRAHELRTN